MQIHENCVDKHSVPAERAT